jgi:hypothetical protein
MPSLDGATEWLNSEPLGPAGLRGHVVLMNFWTLTCINWLRQEPYVRAWSQAYRDDGLIAIGVHTPEFSFEHDVDLVRQATEERAIDYPVVVVPVQGVGVRRRPTGTICARPRRTWAPGAASARASGCSPASGRPRTSTSCSTGRAGPSP